MKYITTDKSRELRAGIILKQSSHDGKYYSPDGFTSYSGHQKNVLLELEEIKELQEPEFTKDDMIDFAKHIDENEFDFPEVNESYMKILINWLKQRNK